jgi:hypothetical protein
VPCVIFQIDATTCAFFVSRWASTTIAKTKLIIAAYFPGQAFTVAPSSFCVAGLGAFAACFDPTWCAGACVARFALAALSFSTNGKLRVFAVAIVQALQAPAICATMRIDRAILVASANTLVLG